jgi:hypothetical protein
MSLILNLLSSDARDKEREALKQSGTNLASIAALGAGGYTFFKTSNAKEAISKSSQVLSRVGKQNELGALGASLRSSADNLAAFKEKVVSSTISRMEEELNNNFDRIFDPETSLEERRQFFAGLFDTLKSQSSESSDPELESLIKGGFKDVEALDESQRNSLRQFYNQRIRTSEKAKIALKKNINRYKGNMNLYSDVMEEFDLSNKITIDTLEMRDLDKNFGSPTANKIRERYNRLQGMVGQGTITLEGVDEFGEGQGTRSLYGRVSYGGRSQGRFILHLGRNADGMAVYRASESMATRYVAPQAVINAPGIFSQGDMRSLNMGKLQAHTMDMEDYLLNILENKYHAPGSLQNMSKRQYSQFNEFARSFGMEAPRGMFDNIAESMNRADGEKFIDNRLGANIYTSRQMQSSMLKIAGLELFTPEQRKEVQEAFLKFAPENFGTVIGAGTTIDNLDDPFDRNSKRTFASIRGMKDFSGKDILNPFTALKKYGIIDRTIVPLTSRIEQFYGRPETLIGVGEDQASHFFGKKGNIKASGLGNELIGVSDLGKKIAGINLGGIFLPESKAGVLGLGEGSGYLGGALMQMEFEQKTVANIGVSSTNLLKELVARKKNPNQKFLKIGADGDMGVEEFFRTYGGSDGDVILGDLDADFVRIRNVKGLKTFNIGIVEQTEDLGRSRFHIGIPKLSAIPGNKIFGFSAKHTMIETNEELIANKLSIYGSGSESILDVYKNDFGGSDASGKMIKNTVFMSSEQLKKSPHSMLTSMVGGMRMLGVDATSLDDVLNNSLNSITDTRMGVQNKQSLYLRKMVEALATLGQAEKISPKNMAYVLNIASEVAEEGKFGFNKSIFEDALRSSGYLDNDEFKAARAEGIHIGASYMGGAGSRLNLGRGEARVEERFANYTYASLRSNYGLTEQESKAFMSSILVRESGFEKKGAPVAGMLLNLESLSRMPGDLFEERIKELELRDLDGEELKRLLTFGTNQEKELVDFLSETKVGSIVDFSKFLTGDKLERIKKQLGGRSKIVLPGADTLQSLEGHEIKAGDKVMQLEAEYNRYMGDLVASISGMSTNQGDDFEASLAGFKSVSSYSAKYSGAAIRGVLARSRILGSGQMEGQGYVFGEKTGMQTDLYGDVAKNIKARERLLELFNREKGLFVMLDAQGFLDTHLSYEAAFKVHLASLNPDRDLKEIALEARAATEERIKNFFLNNFRSDDAIRKITSTTMRNPMMYIAHVAPGSAIYRSDYLQEEDPYFKYLKRQVIGYSDINYERIKEARLKVKREEMRAHLRLAGVIDTNMQDNLLQGMDIETEEDKTAREQIQETLKDFGKRKTDIRAITGTMKEGAFVPGSAQDALIERFRRRSLELYQGIDYDSFQTAMKPLRDEMKALDDLADDFFETEIKTINESLKAQGKAEIEEFNRELDALVKEQFDNPIEASRRKLRVLSELDTRPEYILSLEKRRNRKLNVDLVMDDTRNMMVPQAIFDLEKEIETLQADPEKNYKQIKAKKVELAKLMRQMPFDAGYVSEREAFQVAQEMYEDVLYNRVYKKQYIYGTEADESFQGELRKFYGIGVGEKYASISAAQDKDTYRSIKEAGRAKFEAMTVPERQALIQQMSAFDSSGFLREYLNIERLKSARRNLFETRGEEIKAARAAVRDDVFKNSQLAKDKQDLVDFFNTERARIRRGMDVLKQQAGYREVQIPSKDGKTTRTVYEAYNADEAKGREAFEAQKKALSAIDTEEKAYIEGLGAADKAVYERMQIRRSLERTLRDAPQFAETPAEEKKNIFKLALASIDEEELEADKIAPNLGITKGNVTRTVRELEAIETHLERRINSFEDLAGVEKDIMKLDDDASVTIKDRDYNIKKSFNKLFSGMVDYHTRQPGSGGTLYIPQLEVEMELKSLDGTKSFKKYSGRMDLSRFAIGDFDADIYQVFHEVDKQFSSGVVEGGRAIDNSNLFRTGASFLLMMDQLGKGMKAFGERLLAGNMTDAEFRLDEQRKERFVKAVGSLDVQVKTGIFGIIQAAGSQSGKEGFQATMGRLRAGSALIAVAEEVLSIKAKKLPIAADIATNYKLALENSFSTNDARYLIDFFEQNVFPGTALEGSGFKVTNTEFKNLPVGEASKYLSGIYNQLEFNKKELYESFQEMVTSVHSKGLHSLGSDSRLGMMIKNSDRMDYEKFIHLMSKRSSVQGGFLGVESGLNELQEIMSITRSAGETFASIAGKSKGLAPAVGVGLAAAYGFGALQGVNSLDGESKFSDAIAKESLGGRGLNNSFGREHNDVSPSNVIPPVNFYERTISRMETVMTSNTSTRFYGEAPSVAAGQGVASHYVRAGGSSSFFINDNRMPISNTYITKSIKD